MKIKLNRSVFDNLIKQVKKLESTGVSVPVQTDSEGYYDRECPNGSCLFQFKVFNEDWANHCKDKTIHCPFCGHQAPSKSWWTKGQLKGAKTQAVGYVKAAFNQRAYTVVPVAAQEAMRLKIRCESCSTRFAVVGSAFFCPCCGFNSVERTFDDSLKKVESKLDNLQTIRAALETSVDKDTAEITCRSITESGINDCVVAFQKLMESIYGAVPGVKKPPLNVFQRVDGGSVLWRSVIGMGYEDWLSAEELSDFVALVNKRHLLAHTEGFVDEKYLQKSGDSSYSVGQRIVIREKDVRRLVSIVRLLATKVRERVKDPSIMSQT